MTAKADETLTELYPKLNFLLKGHGVDFDDAGVDPETLAAVDAKVRALVSAHEDGHHDRS